MTTGKKCLRMLEVQASGGVMISVFPYAVAHLGVVVMKTSSYFLFLIFSS